MNTPKALCIQDISSIGRCSLTVATPVLSVLGIQCVPLATTVLSSHFGGFGEVASCDLTNFCKDTLKQFSRIGVKFDCVYSGYLSNIEQMEIVKNAYLQNPDALKVCDPAMADNGEMYSAIKDDVAQGFKTLCSYSDVITPNATEANILIDSDFSKLVFEKQEIEKMAIDLKNKYDCNVVITGAKLENGEVVCCVMQKSDITAQTIKCDYIPVHFPGTGDLFCATMTAYIINGNTVFESAKKATKFVELCIKNTYTQDVDTRFGVNLEPLLKYLL